MDFKSDSGESKIYAVIAIFIIFIVILAIFFSSNNLTEAIIEDNILGDAWSENLAERDGDSQLWGLEKWVSYTYKNNDSRFPAYVTVTSIKNLFMLSEDDLRDQTINTIEQASDQGIIFDESKITGERASKNEHRIMYIVYEGNDTSIESYEQIKIIGEYWNCGVTGASIICIGFAQITNNSETNTDYWARIVRDREGTFGLGDFQGEDGLIFNVKCH